MFIRFRGILIAVSLLSLIPLGWSPAVVGPADYSYANDPSLLNKISVRESTSELQISVGESIFVFGKSKGTLDKVKIGMNVLLFAQAPLSDLNPSAFGKVSWKKMKDGSIQIQSSYSPWPAVLTWTVFADGRLRMEALSGSTSYSSSDWLGLGFNVPDLMLHQITWTAGSSGSENGIWKNSRFTEMADPTLELTPESEALFHSVKAVNLEFEKVTVAIQSDAPSVFFGLGRLANPNPAYPRIPSDLAFMVPSQGLSTSSSSQMPSGPSVSEPAVSQNPLVLWFHFK